KGKVAYMSPEQVQGKPLDGRSDIWALGNCGFWLLVGALPFRRKTQPTTMAAIIDAPMPDLRELRPDVDAAVVDLIASMLAKEPSKRPPRSPSATQASRSPP